MLYKRTRIGRLVGGWGVAVTLLACLLVFPLSAGDIQLPSLRIGTDTFTNVTVYQMTATDIFVRHERGFGNAKVNNLDDTTLVLLGLKTVKAAEKGGGTNSPNAVAVQKFKAALAAQDVELPPDAAAALGAISNIKATPQLMYGVLAGLVAGYLFYCLCLKRVCINAGIDPGPLVWFPVLQMFPLLRAARMPAWWFIVFFIPFLNILAHLLWSARLARACGKGLFVTIMLILPVTNIFAFLYLAFSSGNEAPPAKGVRFNDTPGLARA